MGNVYVEHRAVVWVAEGHLTRSCAPMFKFSYRPQECFPRGKFLPKITIFGDYWCCTTTVLSYNVEISHDFGVSAGSKSNSMRFQHNSRSNTTIQDFPYVHGLIINWHIQDGNVWLLLSLMFISEFLSASLYFSKRGAYWDRLCRDVVGRWSLVGWLSRACTVAKQCILGL